MKTLLTILLTISFVAPSSGAIENYYSREDLVPSVAWARPVPERLAPYVGEPQDNLTPCEVAGFETLGSCNNFLNYDIFANLETWQEWFDYYDNPIREEFSCWGSIYCKSARESQEEWEKMRCHEYDSCEENWIRIPQDNGSFDCVLTYDNGMPLNENESLYPLKVSDYSLCVETAINSSDLNQDNRLDMMDVVGILQLITTTEDTPIRYTTYWLRIEGSDSYQCVPETPKTEEDVEAIRGFEQCSEIPETDGLGLGDVIEILQVFVGIKTDNYK